MSTPMSLASPLRLLAPLLLTAAGAAIANPWITPASVGVVDEADMALIDFSNGEARMQASAATGSVLNLRYNVPSMEGFTGTTQASWTVRFRDNGTGARVRLSLRQYNLTTGLITPIAAFNSDAYPAVFEYQTQSVCIPVTWSFTQGPIYIEAELTRSAAGGTPALGIIMIANGCPTN